MKERILRNWTGPRIFYAAAGLAMCIGSIADKQWIGLLPGGYFLSMGVFAFGCAGGSCYGGSCSSRRTPVKRKRE